MGRLSCQPKRLPKFYLPPPRTSNDPYRGLFANLAPITIHCVSFHKKSSPTATRHCKKSAPEELPHCKIKMSPLPNGETRHSPSTPNDMVAAHLSLSSIPASCTTSSTSRRPSLVQSSEASIALRSVGVGFGKFMRGELPVTLVDIINISHRSIKVSLHLAVGVCSLVCFCHNTLLTIPGKTGRFRNVTVKPRI